MPQGQGQSTLLAGIAIAVILGDVLSVGVGQVAVSNLGENIDAFSLATATTWLANSFTTDNQTYTLNSVTMSLAIGGPTLTKAAPKIYSDSSGVPGSSLENYASQDILIDGDFTFTSAGLTLAPNTTYWLVLQHVGFSIGVQWPSTFSDNQTGSWTIGDTMRESIDSGSTWPNTYSWTGRFSVDATVAPVPEPQEYLLAMGVGLIAFAALRHSVDLNLRRSTIVPLDNDRSDHE